MAARKCPDCGGVVSTKAKACPHCGRPSPSEDASPLLTKPAGVFCQLLGLFLLGTGSFILIARDGGPILGILPLLAAAAFFWLGRQTKPRRT